MSSNLKTIKSINLQTVFKNDKILNLIMWLKLSLEDEKKQNWYGFEQMLDVFVIHGLADD